MDDMISNGLEQLRKALSERNRWDVYNWRGYIKYLTESERDLAECIVDCARNDC